MLKSLRKKSILCVALISVFLFSQNSFSKDQISTRSQMEGEVTADKAYVQTMDSYLVNGSSSIKAKIKIKKTGSYLIIAGFYKGSCWHKGTWTQMKYYSSKQISGDAGDLIDIDLDINTPPLNKNVTVGVFNSINDICTNG